MYSPETHSQFIGLRARGCTLSRIADQLGISFCTARNWAHEHYEEIHDLRDHLRDLFVERCLPDIGEELNSFTAELERINTELDKRDCAEEPTWVLVNRRSMILARLDKARADPPLLIVPQTPPLDRDPDPDSDSDSDSDSDLAPNPTPSQSPQPNAKPAQN